jgi:hypothetical protein
MALRPVSELGLADATDVEARDISSPVPVPSTPRRTRSRRPAQRSASSGSGRSSDAERARPKGAATSRPGVSLADEPTIFVQAMLAGELHQRLADASHVLAAEHWKLRKYKTILGALLWRYVRPDDPESVRELGAALDGFLATDIAEAPAEIKAGAHLPFSLKYSLDGAALALRRTRRDASAKTLLSALIWRYVKPGDTGPLAELLREYDEVSRPRPAPLP